ncbi:MAG: hypothetical protein CMP67_02020 [Flavobacteriales bacterium]|nr:hypothetical protein [Flavobacteriales bacterium]MBO73113.1 hypothetical protein [Flavobacteriales bacterium]|tara:strand:- start:1848 stop:2792 length:945 start_codon:yes stop_codon:yes gene_type:complete
MKLGVIAYPGSINIGDEIQSVAAARLLPRVDEYIDREGMKKLKLNDPVKLICNGWFMEEPNQWPPSPSINPLFISFHVTNSNGSDKKLINSKFLDYYKKHEPIGCRDLGTKRLFESIGVKAYLSQCLTLTLENKFTERNNKILLVDPFRRNFTKGYREYYTKKIVPKKYLNQVEIIEQRRYNLDASRETRFQDASDLIDRYAKAKMVITSRIHCALPCLALGTPVYFVNSGYTSKASLNDRFEGLIELFNVIGPEHFPHSSNSVIDYARRFLNIYREKEIKPLDINWENPSPNPVDISKIKNKLKETVANFIKE